MSSGHQQHLTTTDIEMFNRILERAGIRDISDSPGQESRLKAARFLIETFQRGTTDEGTLYFALQNRRDDLPDQGPFPVAVLPVARPVIVRKIPRPVPHAKGGYRFGRRVENDGTWTIYHVFSGEPAKYGSWNMSGLNVRTAARALRILNTPMAAA